MKKINLNIIQHSLRNNKVNQLKLYVYLSANCSGMMRIDKAFVIKASQDLGYKTKKTFHNNLKKLLSDNWVGFDAKSQYYFIRSVNVLFEPTKRQYKVHLSHLKDFRGFLSACVIDYACRAVKFAKKDLAKESDIALQKSNSEGQLISNCYLSTKYDFCLSKSRRVKQRMVSSGYGTVKRVFNKIDESVKAVKYLNNYTGDWYFKRKGQVFLCLPDRCKANLSGSF